MSYIKVPKPDDGVEPGTTTQSLGAGSTSIYVSGPAARPAEETHARTLKTAWLIEGAVISISLLVAVMIAAQTGHLVTGIAAAAPFVGAATVELARIPLANLAFEARGLFFKSLAVAMLAGLSLLTTENLLIGFEGAFNVRIQKVRQAAQAASKAQARVIDLEREAEEIVQRRAALERRIAGFASEAEGARSRADADIVAATAATAAARSDLLAQREAVGRQISDLLSHHRKAEAAIGAACRNNPDRVCGLGAVQRRNAGDLAPLQQRMADLDAMVLGRAGTTDSERTKAIASRDSAIQQVRIRQSEIEAHLSALLAQGSTAAARLSEARQEAISAQASADAMRHDSTMHRLAGTLLGSQDEGAVQRVLTMFATVASLVLSLSGAVVAILCFRCKTQSRQEIRLRGADTAGQLVVVPVPAGIEPAARQRIVDQAIATRRAKSPAANFRVVLVELPRDADEETRRQLIAEAVAAAA